MNNHAIKSGVILAVFGIVLTLIMYMVDPTLLASTAARLVILVVFLGLLCYFGIQHRKEIGGFMSFGKGWMYSFQAFVVAGILSTIFNILLFNVIDPELGPIVADQTVENAADMMSGFGMPEDQMEEALEKTRQDTLDSFTTGGALKGFGIGLIIYAILSLITGAIIKKKEPEFEG